MGPSCPLEIAHIDPAQEKNRIRTKFCNSWTISAMEIQKAAEESQNKESRSDSHEFTYDARFSQ